jgi:hypothetical protein
MGGTHEHSRVITSSPSSSWNSACDSIGVTIGFRGTITAKTIQKYLTENFQAEFSSRQALYIPTISTLFSVAVQPLVLPVVDCKYGQKLVLFSAGTYSQVWPVLYEAV